MTSTQNFMSRLSQELPDLCMDKHLVDMGIYSCQQAAYAARMKGSSPPWLKIPKVGVRYPKDGVIEYLKKCEMPKNYTIEITDD